MSVVLSSIWRRKVWYRLPLAIGCLSVCVGMICAGLACESELQPPGTLAPGEFVYYPNPTDPLLLSTKTTDGGSLEIYGEKDDAGMPLGANAIRYQTPQQVGTPDGTWVEFDEQGRVTSMIGPDGSEIRLVWESDTVATVSAVQGDGVVQLNFKLDLENPGGSDSRVKLVDAAVPSDRLGQPSVLTVLSRESEDIVARLSQKAVHAAKPSDAGRILVDVQRCGTLVDGANVFVTCRFPNRPFAEVFLARPTGNIGEYAATLPTVFNVNDINISTACEILSSILGNICTAKSLGPNGLDQALCLQLSLIIDAALLGPTGEAAAIMALCQGGAIALDRYCQSLGQSPLGGPSLGEKLCEKVKETEDRAPATGTAQIEIQTWAELPGVPKQYNAAQFVYAIGNYPKQQIVFDNQQPSIGRFFTTPDNPGPGQGYTARAELSCIPSATVIRISVVGDDLYTDSHEITVSEQDPNPIIELSVPGAPQGVKDVVTVEAVGGILILNPPFVATTLQLKRSIPIEF